MSVVITDTETEVIVMGTVGPQGPPGQNGSTLGNSVLQIEAGEDIVALSPVVVVANKVYKASNTVNNDILGVTTADTLQGYQASVILSGTVVSPGNNPVFNPGYPYYLGDKVLTSVPPTSGYVLGIGFAPKADTLLVNIEKSILLT